MNDIDRKKLELYNKRLELYSELVQHGETIFNMEWVKRNILNINPLYEKRKRIIEKILKDSNDC